MIKNPVIGWKPRQYYAAGLPHPAKLLAKTRHILRSAKRHSRFPVTMEFYRSPQGRKLEKSIGPNDYSMIFKIPHRNVRYLQPAFKNQVDPEVVHKYQPEMSDYSVESMRQAFAKMALLSWGCIGSYCVEPPSLAIGKELELVCDDKAISTAPTHFLAIHTRAPNYPHLSTERIKWKLNYRRELYIYPIHAIPFITNCANFPHVPKVDPVLIPCKPSTTTQEEDSDDKSKSSHRTILRLPTIRLSIPVPSLFRIIQLYLYTLNLRQLSMDLIPYPLPELSNPPHPDVFGGEPPSHSFIYQHAVNAANKFTLSHLQIATRNIFGVYLNMRDLAITDPLAWKILAVNWEAASGAVVMIKAKAGLKAKGKAVDALEWALTPEGKCTLVAPSPTPATSQAPAPAAKEGQ
ncbi:hypothetical protein ABKN59_006209 [Abortiporus biennis]